MKIVNLKKKIGASLLAVGLLTPMAAYAAGVNVNLLVDPSFEDVNVAGPTGSYDTKGLNSWSDGFQIGSTYRYDQDYDKPQLGDGTCGFNDPACNPPNSGLTYFTANYPNADTTGTLDTFFPGDVMQIVDVSFGDAATAIAAGTAEYLLGGWFGGYGGTGSSNAILQLDFLGTGGSLLGTASTTVPAPDPPDPENHFEWSKQSTSGLIPVGTLTVQASVYSDDTASGAAYVDLAEFIINPESTLGDFDNDGDVDGADFLEWQRDMNVGSLSDWEGNFGATPLGIATAAAVPEPGTCILVSMGLLLVTGTRKQKNEAAHNGK